MSEKESSSPMEYVNFNIEKSKKGFNKEMEGFSGSVKKAKDAKSQLRDEVQLVEDSLTDWPEGASSSEITYSNLSDKRKKKKKKSKKKSSKGSAKSRK